MQSPSRRGGLQVLQPLIRAGLFAGGRYDALLHKYRSPGQWLPVHGCPGRTKPLHTASAYLPVPVLLLASYFFHVNFFFWLFFFFLSPHRHFLTRAAVRWLPPMHTLLLSCRISPNATLRVIEVIFFSNIVITSQIWRYSN